VLGAILSLVAMPSVNRERVVVETTKGMVAAIERAHRPSRVGLPNRSPRRPTGTCFPPSGGNSSARTGPASSGTARITRDLLQPTAATLRPGHAHPDRVRARTPPVHRM